jgi:hypothetical protein
MKLTVVHDPAGNVLDLVAYPSDAPPAYPANPGGLVTQVEVSDLTVELGAKRIIERLNGMLANYRVEVGAGGKSKLVERK